MLIPANEISPNAFIITRKFPNGNTVVEALLLEDGYIQIKYEDDSMEYLPSNQIVMRRDPALYKKWIT